MPSASLTRKLIRLLGRRRLRPFFIAGVAALVITEIVALSPSSLEDGGEPSTAVDPDTLVDEETTLATGLPKGQIPEYSIDQFQYVSTQGTEKQWKLVADKAYLYNREKIVHTRKINAYLYDPDGKITVVTGREAKYFMNQRDLEIFGDVHTVFPDGFELDSDYLRYRPGERRIEIPNKYPVRGRGTEGGDQAIAFDSHGMDYAMAKATITLPEAVRLVFNNKKAAASAASPAPSGKGEGKSSEGPTVIESDRAVILRDKQISHFTMYPSRPLPKRFVRITQPTMYTQARRAELRYGNARASSSKLQYMVVYEDVLVKQIGPRDEDGAGLTYATGGRADFDARSDVIRLTEFPQAYQDNDTITGDVIILHRDTDLVEVEHSNAFSQGT